jgi:hypothetical protein
VYVAAYYWDCSIVEVFREDASHEVTQAAAALTAHGMAFEDGVQSAIAVLGLTEQQARDLLARHAAMMVDDLDPNYRESYESALQEFLDTLRAHQASAGHSTPTLYQPPSHPSNG